MLHDHVAGGLFRGAVDRPTLVVHAIAQRATGNCPNGTSDESTAEGVAAAAIVAYDRAGERAKGAARDGTLLSVGSRADASGEQTGNGQDQDK